MNVSTAMEAVLYSMELSAQGPGTLSLVFPSPPSSKHTGLKKLFIGNVNIGITLS